jgi:hypothetical protein
VALPVQPDFLSPADSIFSLHILMLFAYFLAFFSASDHFAFPAGIYFIILLFSLGV